ncbi:kinesin-like protein KIN-1 [Impatiens glandulifera]|uniref:kinesin-like protein KIN-1 n=1 Tax=Impatiens glandulifera TaxID=253017 RepID=UPI001FB1935F|nr:kinesin-like protein KIN-1 [Impatiens glandulifera]
MSNIIVCARFRPLSSKEIKDHGDGICIQSISSESFNLKDEREGEFTFSFDKVFYDESEQVDVYSFIAMPIIRDAVNAINGTIITYGQTGAGKTYSMEGPNILACDENKKGLLPRVVEGLFEGIGVSKESIKYTIKLSMVEIYMEKIRDLFDLSKDNIQIKESKTQGMLLSGVTEISVVDPTDALRILSSGIANRAVGETQMNIASSRSHCAYIFTVHQESTNKKCKTGKLVLMDLAGSEKVEKTGAEGKTLEEAKTINKSLSALGNVINALTCGSPGSKQNHIPFRDSKLTRILQDSLGGTSQAALLCCCSPSSSNASETLSSLRFAARARHVKTSQCINIKDEKCHRNQEDSSIILTEKSSSRNQDRPSLVIDDGSCERILNKLSKRLHVEDVKLLEELFIVEGVFFDLTSSAEELESAYNDITSQTISALQQEVEDLVSTNKELIEENKSLKARLGEVAYRSNPELYFFQKISPIGMLWPWTWIHSLIFSKSMRYVHYFFCHTFQFLLSKLIRTLNLKYIHKFRN